MKNLIFIIALLTCVSCVSKTARINRWLIKYPGLTKSDTVRTTKTVTVLGDSFHAIIPTTIQWNTNPAPIEYRFNDNGVSGVVYIKGDTLRIAAKCPDIDTAVAFDKVVNIRPDKELEDAIRKKSGIFSKFWRWVDSILSWITAILAIGFIVYILIQRRKK